jgi:hypothetical protein
MNCYQHRKPTITKTNKRARRNNWKNEQNDRSMSLLIITLNVYGLNSQIKRYRLDDWIKKKIKPGMVVHTCNPST